MVWLLMIVECIVYFIDIRTEEEFAISFKVPTQAEEALQCLLFIWVGK